MDSSLIAVVDKVAPWYTHQTVRLAPALAALESYVRSAAYCLPGRFSSSELLLQSLTTLLDGAATLHDALILHASHTSLPLPSDSPAVIANHVMEFARSAAPSRLPAPNAALALSLIRAGQVLLEVAAVRWGGPSARWLVVTLVEAIKAFVKLVALLRTRAPLLPLAIPNLIRDPALRSSAESVRSIARKDRERKAARELFRKGAPGSGLGDAAAQFDALVGDVSRVSPAALLKRRKSAWAHSPSRTATAEPPAATSPGIGPAAPPNPSPLTRPRLIGELLHIATPLVYVAGVRTLGHRAWTPWLISLILDLGSIGASASNVLRLNSSERGVLLARIKDLRMYLVRIPFFDAVTARALAPLFWLLRKVGGAAADEILALPETHFFYTTSS